MTKVLGFFYNLDLSRFLPMFSKAITLLLAATLPILANPGPRDFPDNDFQLKAEFVNPKRTLNLEEKKSKLRFSGDARVDWLYRKERLINEILRGGGARDRSGVPIPSDEISTKISLKIDYKSSDIYGLAQIECDNLSGILNEGKNCKALKESGYEPQHLFGSGLSDHLSLKRMFIGAVLWKENEKKWIAEIGRKSLYYTFDSRIQYKARVDGIFSKFSNDFCRYEDERSSEFYVTGGYFLIDAKSNHFGWAYELGLYNLMDSSFDIKYSMIDWRQFGKNSCGIKNPRGWKFLNSQVCLDYNFRGGLFGKNVNIYSAALMNHLGKPGSFYSPILDKTFDFGSENFGGYLGFIVGEVNKAGDWSLDCNYQYVQAQAIPDCDVRGIGTGNFRKEIFYVDRRGNGNFKGIHIEFLYAITDALQLDINLDLSTAINKKFFGGPHRYHKYEVELIHAF